MTPDPHQDSPSLPGISPGLLTWFAAYSRWYLGRHFHAVRLASPELAPVGAMSGAAEGPARVIFLNHASWWDPLVCLAVHRSRLRAHPGFAPIDAAALRRYAFFRRLGFFGIEPDSSRGASAFLGIAQAILARPGHVLWLTPQGRFADARERPVRFRRGLGHLAHRLQRRSREPDASAPPVEFVPLAIEYTHWHERLPEVLLRFGPAIGVGPGTPPRSADDWNQVFEQGLVETQEVLARLAIQRDAGAFRPLISGSTAVAWPYDLWRRLTHLVRGTRFDPRHGQL